MPQLTFVSGRMDVYKAVSRQIHEIFHEYTDIVEPLSLDEAFLDVTENKQNIPLAVDIAKAIKQKIREELHLIASVGYRIISFWLKSPLTTASRTDCAPSIRPGGRIHQTSADRILLGDRSGHRPADALIRHP